MEGFRRPDVAGRGRITRWLESVPGPVLVLYAVAASFSTYFCMYAFRRPFAPSITQRSPWSVLRPRSTSARRKAAQTRSFSVAVWTKPRRTF